MELWRTQIAVNDKNNGFIELYHVTVMLEALQTWRTQEAADKEFHGRTGSHTSVKLDMSFDG